MKKRLKYLLAAGLMTASVAFGGCFSQGSGNGTGGIASIDTKVLADGRTEVTITYDSVYVPKDVFYIPKGDTGENGNGIKEITPVYDEETGITTVTVTYTDENMTPVTFDIPSGVSVVGLDPVTDENGLSCIVFKYSDGSISDFIELPKGDKGNGIKVFDVVENGDKSVTINIELDDGTQKTIQIPPPQNGVGVSNLVYIDEERYDKDGNLLYVVEVQYTDGNTTEIEFPRPSEPNQWLSGSGRPFDMDGKNGDYYFDFTDKTIYYKQMGMWMEVIDFDGEDTTTTYTIKFDVNAEGDSTARLLGLTGINSVRVTRGSYLTNIPYATRDGYDFKGWSRSAYHDDDINGKFTDLTPVFDNLTLYAIWEKL